MKEELTEYDSQLDKLVKDAEHDLKAISPATSSDRDDAHYQVCSRRVKDLADSAIQDALMDLAEVHQEDFAHFFLEVAEDQDVMAMGFGVFGRKLLLYWLLSETKPT